MAGWLPRSPAAVDGALKTQALDDMRIGAIGTDVPYRAFVGRLLSVDLHHPILVAPVTLVGVSHRNPFAIR